MSKLKNSRNVLCEQHPFHLVNASPWPFLVSISVFSLAINFVMYMHYNPGSSFRVLISFIFLLFFMYTWFVDIIEESTFDGHHTLKVQQGLRYGMALFIVSEVMFFFSFFWAFFHSSLSPSVDIGCIWPPLGIETLDPWGIPLLNTVILLSSGVSVTWAHRAIVGNEKTDALVGLFVTIVLGLIFTGFQIVEYVSATFSINDGIYGSLFYMCTGFHGFHVVVGTIFLIVCFFRQLGNHFSAQRHFGFEAAAWYWHFVDVVWLFLFISIYWWGS